MFTLIIYILIAALGFIMVYLYRQTNTTAKIFKPDPKNAMKLFLFVFVVATVTTFALSHLTTYELNSSSIASENAEKYQNVNSVMLFMINFFFFLLVMLSNAYSLALKKLAIGPYLLTIGFYALFIIKDTYYIVDYYNIWQKSLEILKGESADLHHMGQLKCALGSAVTLLNAGMVWFSLRRR
jgi:hypothetical protein